MEKSKRTDILQEIDTIETEAKAYFKKAGEALPNEETEDFFGLPCERDCYWGKLPTDLQSRAETVASRVVKAAPMIAEAARLTTYLTSADQQELGLAIKGMRAALYLRRYRYWDTEVLHDEGTVLGVQAAGQREDQGLYPLRAAKVFDESVKRLRGIIELTSPASIGFAGVDRISTSELVAGYRPGTAFIMMWMDPDDPNLDDISDTVKRCFKTFDIEPNRADDIQHEDLITKRILEEIRTAEFLFGDLTGERPSVYYEVGYAHAIGRRVILFRKKGTRMHFDLAGYNCPEYKNMRELEKSLMKRLSYVTGREPSS